MNKLCLSGKWTFERYTPYGVLVAKQVTRNDIMLAQVNDLLDVYFKNGTPATTWSIGLIGGSTVTITTADSMSSHAGWTEDENYTESTRQAWAPDSAASQIIENSSSVVFTANADTTIRGLFLTTNNTKGGTTGSLWSAAALDLPEDVKSGQIIRAFYELTGSGV